MRSRKREPRGLDNGCQRSSFTTVLMCSTPSAISPDTIEQSCSHVRYIGLVNGAYAELSMARPCRRKRAQKVNIRTAIYSRSRETSLFRWGRTHEKSSSSAARTFGAGRRLKFLLSEVSNLGPMNSKVVVKGRFASGSGLN